MQQWTDIRRRVLVEGASKRSICREYGIAFETLQKILRHAEPPGYRLILPRAKTKLGPYLPVISAILLSDRDAPPKQRHPAKVFVPLSHPPGEAQFDFGFATVKIAGIERKAACAVMCLPYSDAFLVQAYPRECTETFQAAHTAAFSFFGGVPTKISYDNTSIAVRKIVGRDRELTQGFLRLESHFLFRHRF